MYLVLSKSFTFSTADSTIFWGREGSDVKYSAKKKKRKSLCQDESS